MLEVICFNFFTMNEDITYENEHQYKLSEKYSVRRLRSGLRQPKPNAISDALSSLEMNRPKWTTLSMEIQLDNNKCSADDINSVLCFA